MTGNTGLRPDVGGRAGRAEAQKDGGPRSGDDDLKGGEQTICSQDRATFAAVLLAACLTPLSTLAALWSTTDIGWSAFALTFDTAFGHGILLGLPLFLIFRSAKWVNAAACSIAGFAVCGGPAAVLSWPRRHLQFEVKMSTTAAVAAQVDDWIGYIASPLHWGLLGALAGLAFWLAMRQVAAPERPVMYVRLLQSRRSDGNVVRAKIIRADKQAPVRSRASVACCEGRVTPSAHPPVEPAQSFTTRTAPLAALDANAA